MMRSLRRWRIGLRISSSMGLLSRYVLARRHCAVVWGGVYCGKVEGMSGRRASPVRRDGQSDGGVCGYRLVVE